MIHSDFSLWSGSFNLVFLRFKCLPSLEMGFLGISVVKNPPAMQEMQDTWVRSLSREDPWRKMWLPTPIFLSGEFNGQRSLTDYSPWGYQESDTTEWLSLYFPWWYSGKEFTHQCRRLRFSPWIGKIPWRRKWQPTPVFLPGKFHGQRSLEGYSPRGHKRVGHNLVTEQPYMRARSRAHTHTHTHTPCAC